MATTTENTSAPIQEDDGAVDNAAAATYNSKLETFRDLFETALKDIDDRTLVAEKEDDSSSTANAKAAASRRCLILSGGVDTCAILRALQKLDIFVAAAITVICSDRQGKQGPDLEFAQAAYQ